MRVHFCASRFLLKVLATLASGSERQRVTAQITVYRDFFPCYSAGLRLEAPALESPLKPSLPCDRFTLSREVRKTIRDIIFLATPIGQAF
jgi:hypothetical protein